MVTDTLTVNGTIKTLYDIAGSGSGGPRGGNSGGNLELMAKTIEGTGTISVDGESGSSGNNFGNNSNGGSGAGYSIPATGASGTGGTNPSVGTNRYYDGNNWNGNNGGGSGNAHSSVYNDSTLKPYLEDYLLSGAYITQSPLDTLLPGSGDSGAGGGNEQLRMYNPANHGNNNNNYGSYVDVGGGGGGAGGSFASKGGGGGNGDDDQANKNHYLSHQSNNDTSYNSYARANVRGGEGGAGGGAGGFILLVSESVGLGVTFSAKGGQGGDGFHSEVDGYNRNDGGGTSNFNIKEAKRDGGGGGGGAGGLVIGFADQTPSLDLGGGVGGIPGGQKYDGSNFNSNAGKTGQDGITFIYDIKELL
ncbi:hypothetical protein [Halospeciosus flavus]|uniref:PE-PGRS family protein n=1 Tax=Halospeciosus flavus TaxID=3032283 RepID=A0ABD5Z2N2_9EURY|nr:hypothetical protein [Halospeciosus flavus]